MKLFVQAIIPLSDMFWCQIGGHFRTIASSENGIVWGISYDNSAYYYTIGDEINPLTDTQNYYIYENQRWNPLTGRTDLSQCCSESVLMRLEYFIFEGYTSHGLPTDRHMWSDATGRKKRCKENSKLPSPHWHWVCVLSSFNSEFNRNI